MRNLVLMATGVTVAAVLLIGLLLALQVSQLQGEVSDLSARLERQSTSADVVDDLRSLDRRLDALSTKVDDMTARFDRLDASIAEIPTSPANDTRIGTILSELQALQGALNGLSLDLGIVCDVIGC